MDMVAEERGHRREGNRTLDLPCLWIQSKTSEERGGKWVRLSSTSISKFLDGFVKASNATRVRTGKAASGDRGRTALRSPDKVCRYVGEDDLRRDHEKGGERIESDEARAVRDTNGKERV